jgi:hypothetical protein
MAQRCRQQQATAQPDANRQKHRPTFIASTRAGRA